jgi:hypothetical protein
MLDKLSKEQIDLVNIVTREYIDLHTKQWRCDDEIIEKVKFIYGLYKLQDPEVYIFDSPIECQEFLNEDFLHIYSRDTEHNEERMRKCRESYQTSINGLAELISNETYKLIKDINKVASLGNIDKITVKFIANLFEASRNLMSAPFNSLYDVNRRIDPKEKELEEIFFKVSKQIKENVDQDVINFIKDNIRREINIYLIYDLHFINLLTGVLKEREKDKSKILTYFTSDVDKGYDLGLIGYYDYFKRIGITKLDKEENDKFDKFLDYVRMGIIYTIYLNKRAIVSRNPLYILREDISESSGVEHTGSGVEHTGRMTFRLTNTTNHSARFTNKEGYAVEWRNGDGLHFVNGVYLGESLFRDIFINGFNGDYSKIFKLENTEHKTIAIQHIGYDKLLDKLGAKKLDEWATDSIVNGNTAVCELFEFELDRSTFRFVKVQDHSTGKITALGVPVISDTKTAKGAVAWSFGMTEEEYNPTVET